MITSVLSVSPNRTTLRRYVRWNLAAARIPFGCMPLTPVCPEIKINQPPVTRTARSSNVLFGANANNKFRLAWNNAHSDKNVGEKLYFYAYRRKHLFEVQSHRTANSDDLCHNGATENTGVENRGGSKRRSGIVGRKSQGWKTKEDELRNAEITLYCSTVTFIIMQEVIVIVNIHS